MLSYILIDIGTSTIKVYEYTNKKLTHLFNHSIGFKNHMTEDGKIGQENIDLLIGMISKLQSDYQGFEIKIYATAFFRKLSDVSKIHIIGEVKNQTGVDFTIISHEEENGYLQLALLGKVTGDYKVMLLNIGGGSTELVVIQGNKTIATHNCDIGVGTVIGKFDGVNNEFSKIQIEDIIGRVREKLPEIDYKFDFAIYTGGELEYMKRAGYKLTENNFFDDEDHPLVISLSDFGAKNHEVFESIELSELEGLMPENPSWMHGARGCSALAQAIFEHYRIDQIIPSNSNLIDGVARKLSLS